MSPRYKHHAELIREFRRSLRDCRRLYQQQAARLAAEQPTRDGNQPSEWMTTMDELHRGLLLKVFVEMARTDWKWSAEERELATLLFQHIWNQSLEGERLEQCVRHVSQQADKLRWNDLLGPFASGDDATRQEATHLASVVVRMANVVAKIDGRLVPEEATQLMHLQNQLARSLNRPMPLATTPLDAQPSSAMRDVQHTVEAVRDQCDLKPARSRKARVVEKPPGDQLAEALSELDQLIGLASVKQEVHTLVNFLKVQRIRGQQGLPETRVSLHMVFQGNPGTGKTTVARLIGRIFAGMGILARGHLVETDRSGLVAQYAGQTSPKTHRKIDEALDGVLFIDEAYSLISDEGRDAYGHEAVQALLKRMEDDRERLVVILAGYTGPMERLLHSNPGLSSRFSRRLNFPDYSPAELGRIFESMCNKNDYRLLPATRVKLLLGFRYLVQHRDEHFGNGRLSRNVFEQAIRRQANRLAAIAELDRKLLTTLQPDDIEMRGVADAAWHAAHAEQLRLKVHCPQCGNEATPPLKYLGRRVRCRRCDRRFRIYWADLCEPDSSATT